MPLEHHLFFSGKLFKISEKGVMVPEGMTAAQAAYKAKHNPPPKQQAGGGGGGGGGRGGVGAGRQSGGRGGGGGGRGAGGGHRGGGSASSGYYGGGGGRGGPAGRGRSMSQQWSSFIHHLLKNDLLPVSQALIPDEIHC